MFYCNLSQFLLIDYIYEYGVIKNMYDKLK